MKKSKTILMRNASKHQVYVKDLDLNVPPGGTCEVLETYAKSRQGYGGKAIASILTNLAPCRACAEVEDVMFEGQMRHPYHSALIPANAADAARIKTSRELAAEPLPAKLPTTDELIAAGVAPGLAEKLIQLAEGSVKEGKTQKDKNK